MPKSSVVTGFVGCWGEMKNFGRRQWKTAVLGWIRGRLKVKDELFRGYIQVFVGGWGYVFGGKEKSGNRKENKLQNGETTKRRKKGAVKK